MPGSAAAAAWILVALLAVAPSAGAQDAPWVRMTPDELRAVLPPPSAPGSTAAEAELDTVRALQAFRTPALEAEANADAPRGPVEWAVDVLGPAFDRERQPRAVALLERVHADVRAINRAANAVYGDHARPARVDPRVRPSLPNAVGGPTYPSARTAGTRVWAGVLAELYPEHRDALAAAAERSAWLRLLGGAHFPSDLVGGRRVADAVLARLRAHPAFVTALDEARAERAARDARR